MITESVPFINYTIWKPVPSYLYPKPKFLQLQPIISSFTLIIDPKNVAKVLFVVTPISLEYFYEVPSQPTSL